MGEKSKKESRFNLLKPKDSDFENQDLNQRMTSIESVGDFINVRRVKKITLHICESKVPQFEKHMAKFFAKHGYKADISD